MNILIDWGSTNFRAFRMDGDQIVDRREVAGQGILKSFAQNAFSSRGDDYSHFLTRELGDWLKTTPRPSILMCGAVGSREGWVETSYIETPAGLSEFAAKLQYLTPEQRGRLADYSIAIVPGSAVDHKNGRHDVIRSEETKSLGAAAHLGLSDAYLCIPGTNCKWVRIADNKIADFHTILTGELYALLSETGSFASLFRSSTPSMRDVDQHYASFDQGLELAKIGQDLLADIWQVRAQKLRAATPPHSLQSYMSGILIGHEMRQVKRVYPDAKEIVLVSDPGMRQLFYRRAVENFGFTLKAEIDSETAVCTALNKIMTARPAAVTPQAASGSL